MLSSPTLTNIRAFTGTTHGPYGQTVTSESFRNLDFTKRQKIPSDSVDASYESQILMLTNRRLYIHLGYVGAV